jgi:hypothetical protein
MRFHVFELVMNFQDQSNESFLIGLLVPVEFDDPFLQDVEQGIDALIVGLLLGTGGETRVDGHR